MFRRLLKISLLLFPVISFAQPANDDPCNAISLSVGTACNYIQYSNAGATASANVPDPGCANYLGGDVWFSIVVPASGNIILNSNTGSMTDGGMAIYSGTCSSLTLISCDDDSSPNGLMPMISRSGLTPGSTVFVRFWEYGNDDNGTFSLCVYSPVPPSNDEPCDAIPLSVGTACNYSQYSNADATGSLNVPVPGCASYSGGDVWFSLVVPASGNIVINTNTGTVLDGGMAIYSGSCNSLSLIVCDDDGSPNGAMPMITRTGLTPGSTVYVRFWEYGNNNNGTFSICAYSLQSISNDNPCNAISLPVGSNCVMSTYSNIGATGTSGVPAPGCGSYSGGDVWFSAVVPANGILSVNTEAGTLAGAAMAIYSGTCTSLTLIECDDDDGPGLMPGIYRSGLTPGSTLFIRVWDYGNDESGDFSICVKSITCNNASVNSACSNADPFCTGVSYEYCNTTGVASLGGGGAYGCLGSAPNPSFFFFNAATSGPIDIFIQQNTYAGTPIDVDFILWGPFSSYASMCSGYSANNIIDCSYDPAPQETANIPNAVAGQWYLLLITNYSNQAGIFTFSQTNSGAAGSGSTNCNLITANPGPCSNGLFTVSGNVYITNPPSSGSLTVTNSCGGSQVFSAPFTSPLNYSIPNSCANGAVCSVTGVFSAANAPVLLPATYTAPAPCYTFTATPGPCSASGTYVLSGSLAVGCPPATGTLTITSSCGGTVTYSAPFTSSLNWSLPATQGIGGTCQISAVFSAAGAPVISPISVTQPSCCTPVVPTFSLIGPLCYGASPPALPGTSTNGIQGSWNPSVINTTVAGTSTYTFTPAAGSCASSTTMMVTVNPPPVVYAHGTNPTCANLCNGSATVDVVGGTPPYTYTWSNGGSTRTITNLCPGTYTVTVKDASNCSSTTSPVSVAGCFQIQSILVDACSNTEWEQEMVFFQVGANPLGTSQLSVNWPTTSNPWNGLCQNQTFINNTNATITGGGVLIGVAPGGTIPANANVVLISGNTLTVSANSFANLSDTLYVLFQCSGNTAGHFLNYQAGASIRTLSMNFGAGCRDTVSYSPGNLVTTSGSLGSANGAYVNYSANGTATYLNYGCVIPFTIPTATVTLTAPAPVNPAFNPIAPVCQGATAPRLPDSSTNVPSVRGTWSPSVINTAASGTTVYTFTPAAGQCANTATLTVTVNPRVTPSFTLVAPICINGTVAALPTTSNNGIPGTWTPAINNTATTNYTFTPAAGQCATTGSLTIVVNPKYNLSVNASTCTGSYTLPWGPVVNAAGSYSNTYQSVNNCDSIVTINLTMASTTETNINASVCQGQSYVLPWGTSVNAANTYSYTYPGSGGCDSIVNVTLALTPLILPIFDQVSPVCSGAALPSLPTTSSNGISGTWSPALNNTATTTYTFTPAAGQCATTTAMTILIYSNPSLTIQGVNPTCSSACDGSASVMVASGSSPYVYDWNNGGNSPTLSNLCVGLYSVVVTDSNGCVSSGSSSVTLTAPSPVTPSFSIQSVFCQDAVAPTLPGSSNNNPPVSGTWSPSIISTAAQGVATYVFTPSAGACAVPFTLDITIVPPPAKTVSISACANKLPFTWQGHVFSSPGSLRDTVPGINGCDTQRTILFSVNPLMTATRNLSVCANKLPFTWQGHVFTGPGFVVDTVPGISGCDTQRTIILSVNPLLTATRNLSVCANKLPFTWQGHVFMAPATLLDTVPGPSGCDTQRTIILTVDPLIATTRNLSVCANKLPYVWQGHVFTGAATLYDTVPGLSGCDTQRTIILTVNPLLTKNVDLTVCSYRLPYTWQGHLFTAASTILDTVPSPSGCDTQRTIKLVVNPTPSVSYSAVVCANKLPFSWKGHVFTGAGTITDTVSGAPGTCDSIRTLTLSVTPLLTATVNLQVCTNKMPYTWQGHVYSSAGTYRDTVSGSSGCDTQRTVILSVTPLLTTTVNISTCQNNLPYSWQGHVYSSAGTYLDTVPGVSGCDTQRTIVFTLAPLIANTVNLSTCVNNLPYIWQGHVFTGAGTIVDTVPGPSGCDTQRTIILAVTNAVTGQVSLTVCPSQIPFNWNGQSLSLPGTYSAVLTSAANCDSIVTLNFDVRSVNAGNDLSFCSGGSASLSASGAISYSWSPATGLSNPNISNPTASPTVTTAYVVTGQIPTVNLISNSNFNQGNSGFSSSYNYNSSNGWGDGTYFVGSSATAWHPGFAPCADHTSGSGNMMMVNGATTPNVPVYCTTVPVQPNTNYAFSTWLTTFINPPALLQFSINGNLLGAPFSGSSTLCQWNNFCTIWNSGNNTTATICIVNQNTVAGGNDFALDDISFTALCEDVDTVIVSVNPIYLTNLQRSTCAGVPFNLPWGGTAAVGGIYSHAYSTVRGCDSLVKINLTVLDTTSSLTSATVCYSALPYSWNNQSYNASGIYSVNLTNAAGCDSFARLRLVVKNMTQSDAQVSACTSYFWNGSTYSASGHYTYGPVPDVFGCDSIAILHLTILNTSQSDVSFTACTSYSWNGTVYTAGGVYTYGPVANAAGCDSLAILHLAIRNKSQSDTTVSACISYGWNGSVYTAAGTYSFGPMINAAGCDSIAILNLFIKQPSGSRTVVSLCPGSLPYIWNGQGYSSSGVYTAVLVNAAGCDSTALLDFRVKQSTDSIESIVACESYTWHGNTYLASTTAPVFTTTNAAGCDSVVTLHLTINNGVHAVINQSACLNYSWYGNTYTASGDYIRNYQDANGCASSDTLRLTISNGIPNAVSQTACNSYIWNGTTYTASGDYLYGYSSGTCNVTDTLHLTIRSGSFAGSSATACESYLWNGNLYTGSGTYLYNYSNGFGCPSADTLRLVINSGTFTQQALSVCDSFSWNGNTYSSSGDYVRNFINPSGCLSADTLHLTVHEGTFTLQTQSACQSYYWNGNVYTSSGRYIHPYSNSFGCLSADTLELTISTGTPATTIISVCDSFAWNGNTYLASGQYLHAYGSGSCNVTDTLQLTIQSGTFNAQDANACLNYTWHGSIYTSSGTYVYNYSNSNGCNSADTLHLSVSNAVPSVTTASACGSYIWNGTTYTAGGTYLHSFVSGVCQITDTLHLTIHSGTFTAETQSACQVFSWHGNTYTVSGDYFHDYVNSSGCPSADTLHLTINNGTFSSTDQSACNSFVWNGVTYSTSGHYVHYYSNTYGCPSADTLHLVISTGAPIVYPATACNSYLWNGATYTQSGTYVYQYPPGSGCLTADTLKLTVNSGTFTSTSRSSCGSYFWNGQTYTQSGAYLNSYVNASGCPSADTLVLRIDPVPPAPSVASPAVYCQQGVSAPLTATAQGSLVWYSSPSGGVGSATAPTPNTGSIGSAYYYVSQTIGSCEGPRAALLVRVVAKPVLGIDRDIHLCFGRTLNLEALYNTDGLNAMWTFNQQHVSNPSSVDAPGVYQLIVSNTAGCRDTSTVRLSMQPQLMANAGPDDTADYYTPYQLHGSGGGSYLWTPGPPVLNNAYLPSPIALITETTQFILEVQDPIGCKDYDTVVIYVRLGEDFYVPNAFSPNGDGINDFFSPVPLGGIAELEYFAVYNRFGNLVFQTSNIWNRWDGKYAGRPQDPGNFVWVLKGKNRRGEVKFLKGNVILIR